jgi:hypothetical protein
MDAVAHTLASQSVMSPPTPIYTRLALALVVGVFGCLVWRATLPNNRQQAGQAFEKIWSDGTTYYLPLEINQYDNAVTQVTAANFARDGFRRTHFLANRGRHVKASLLDGTGTQCVSRVQPRNLLTYSNFLGHPVEARSLNNDCVYPHYPPLIDWLFGLLATAGFGQTIYYKLVALAVNCAWLFVLYFWLRREVVEPAALLALVLVATLPTFLQWADVLYYHSFQFLFFAIAIASWCRFLEQRDRVSFAITWTAYLLESLTSFELTMCLGITLAGTLLLARPTGPRRSPLFLLFLQALAPVVAFSLQVALIASFLGFDGAARNLGVTMFARMGDGAPGGLLRYFQWVDRALLPLAILPVIVLAFSSSRFVASVSLRRPVALLAILLLGGLSFLVVFPGMTSSHPWMMYRHLIPFIAFLLAYLLDSAVLCMGICARTRKETPTRYRRVLAGLCLLLTLLPLSCLVYRNGGHVRGEIGWNLARNRHASPQNLVLSALDVVYWNEGAPYAHLNYYAPINGLRTGEPPGWVTSLRLVWPGSWHYEIWWLDEVPMKTVGILLGDDEVQAAREHCRLRLFDGADFRDLPDGTDVAQSRFTASADEPPPWARLAWLRFTLPHDVRTRALRLSCRGLNSLVLRQVEAYSASSYQVF